MEGIAMFGAPLIREGFAILEALEMACRVVPELERL